MANTDPIRIVTPTAGSYPLAPADEWSNFKWATGTETPAELAGADEPRTVVRAFAFLDMCGSTAYLESAGAAATLEAVTRFRAATRHVAARRGVRVAKWMGDGAMIVGVTSGPTVAAAVELTARFADAAVPMRAGVAISDALLFDGDDYLGRGANYAARLCNEANPAEVLCDLDCAPEIPDWVSVAGPRKLTLRGMGTHRALVLGVPADLALPDFDAHTAGTPGI